MGKQNDELFNRNMLLPLIGSGDSRENRRIYGITRLQKMMFLLRHECLFPTYRFEAGPFGPFSHEIYNDLWYLENIGLVETRVYGEMTDVEKIDYRHALVDLSDDAPVTQDIFESRLFTLTCDGMGRIFEILEDKNYAAAKSLVREIKRRFGSMSIDHLLKYVFSECPEYFTNQEVKNYILRG